jgi:PAS domain S-box-containing protein
MSGIGTVERNEAVRRQEGMRLVSEALHEFAEATSDYPRLLAVIAERIARTIGDVCIVLLLADDKESLVAATYFDRDPEVARQYAALFQKPLSMKEPTLARQAMTSGEPICIPSLDVEHFRERTTIESYELHRRIGAHGVLVVPLRVRNQPIGSISIVRYREEHPPLDAIDVEIACSLASHAALAITNWRLFLRALGEMDRRVKAEAALFESEQLRRAEQDAARARRFLDAIIENIPDMVFVKEAENLTFTRFNRAGEELLGMPRAELMGKSDYDFFPRNEAEFFIEKDRETLAHKKMVDIPEEPIRTARGTRWLHTKKVPILDAEGQPAYLLGISQDITDRRIAQASLLRAKEVAEAANRELEAFSYSVAHDLRSPLRAIDGFSQALLEDYSDKLDDEGRSHLRRVRESAQRMAELIDDLLTLSRVSRADMRRQQVDITELAKGVVTRLRGGDAAREAIVRIPGGLYANADRGLLGVVFDNLLGNAWKFTNKRAKAEIEVGATEQNGEKVFFIKDNGAGFDMAYADRLFGVFQRLHHISEFEGTGIGLATVQRIINRHGGRIWAEGELDRGATFFFTLADEEFVHE